MSADTGWGFGPAQGAGGGGGGEDLAATLALGNTSSGTDLLVSIGDDISSPSSGTDSEAFGAGATTTGDDSLAVGTGAVSTENSVVIGKGASSHATGTENNVVIKGSIVANHQDNVVIHGSIEGAKGSPGVSANLVIGGRSTAVGGYYDTVVGMNALAYNGNITTLFGAYASGNRGIAIGRAAMSGWAGVSIGDSSNSINQECVAIGDSANAANSSIALGHRAISTAGQMVCGGESGGYGSEITDVVFGKGTLNAAPDALLRLRTTGTTTGTGVNNTAGMSLQIESGAGTGTGAVTTIALKTPTVAGSGDGAQALATRLTVSSTAATFTVPLAAPSVTAISNGTSITATDTAVAGERMIYDPTGGTFQLNAPASPVIGTRWAVKNRSTSTTGITISGNSNSIENPASGYAVAASFSLAGDGISVEWEYDGTQWLVI